MTQPTLKNQSRVSITLRFSVPDRRTWLPEMTDESGATQRAAHIQAGRIEADPQVSAERPFLSVAAVYRLRCRLIKAGVIFNPAHEIADAFRNDATDNQ